MFVTTQCEGQLVLSTNQLAEVYETQPKILTNNFSRNKSKFSEGVHFFILKGEDLKKYKGSHQNDVTLKFLSILYLWTEKGALLLAKSLNTDKAWQAYNMLVDQYYHVTQQLQHQQALPYDEKRLIALENRLKEIELQLQLVTLHSGEQKRLQKAISERVYAICDVKARRPAYFSALYRAIKQRYSVESYRDVPQCKLQDALQFVASFEGGVGV